MKVLYFNVFDFMFFFMVPFRVILENNFFFPELMEVVSTSSFLTVIVLSFSLSSSIEL